MELYALLLICRFGGSLLPQLLKGEVFSYIYLLSPHSKIL
jgi:hypothetical protein